MQRKRGRLGWVCATVTALCVVPAVAAAGTNTISPCVVEGDVIADAGKAVRIDNVAINNSGQWLVEARLEHEDANAYSVVLRDGVVILREGDAIGDAGAYIAGFDALHLNAKGVTGWNLFLSGVPETEDSAVFVQHTMHIREGEYSTAAEFGSQTVYLGFFDARINAAGNVAIIATVDDPEIVSRTDRAIVLVHFDESGALQSETVIAKEGAVPAGQTEPFEDFQTGPHCLALNNDNAVLFLADLAGDTARDDVIYLNDALIAQQGAAAPVAGRTYRSLAVGAVDLNNHGEFVFRALLDGDASTSSIIVKNNATFRLEGDPITTARGTFALTGFGNGPIAIADTGSVLWFGEWDDPDTTVNSGIFLDDELLVQEGVTVVADSVVDTIATGEDAMAFSDNGRFIIFEAMLRDGRNGAFVIDVPLRCAADITDNGFAHQPDGVVDVFDLLAVLTAWTTDGPGANIANAPNNTVDVLDLLELLSNWGDC